jgi:hypothetical protein
MPFVKLPIVEMDVEKIPILRTNQTARQRKTDHKGGFVWAEKIKLSP